MPILDIHTLENIVVPIAQQELLPRFAKVKSIPKSDGSIVTEADLIVQQQIASQLHQYWPDIELLAEEMPAEQQQRLFDSGRPLWCLDPLDGTSNFAAGVPYFCVSLALLENGQVTAGIVYDPVRHECFTTIRSEGAKLNGQLLTTKKTGLSLKQTIGLIDFKRLPIDLATRLLMESPYASQRSFGSVALDWCWIAANRCHIYLHGRQQIWDYAAGSLILHEAGGHSTTLSGELMLVNKLSPRSAVASLDKHIFNEWVQWLNIPSSDVSL